MNLVTAARLLSFFLPVKKLNGFKGDTEKKWKEMRVNIACHNFFLLFRSLRLFAYEKNYDYDYCLVFLFLHYFVQMAW